MMLSGRRFNRFEPARHRRPRNEGPPSFLQYRTLSQTASLNTSSTVLNVRQPRELPSNTNFALGLGFRHFEVKLLSEALSLPHLMTHTHTPTRTHGETLGLSCPLPLTPCLVIQHVPGLRQPNAMRATGAIVGFIMLRSVPTTVGLHDPLYLLLFHRLSCSTSACRKTANSDWQFHDFTWKSLGVFLVHDLHVPPGWRYIVP